MTDLKTLDECFEEAGKKLPFRIWNNIMQKEQSVIEHNDGKHGNFAYKLIDDRGNMEFICMAHRDKEWRLISDAAPSLAHNEEMFEAECKCSFIGIGHDNDCAYVASRKR